MRVAIEEPLGLAWEAARSIAQMVWRVVMARKNTLFDGQSDELE